MYLISVALFSFGEITNICAGNHAFCEDNNMNMVIVTFSENAKNSFELSSMNAILINKYYRIKTFALSIQVCTLIYNK